MTEIDVNDMHKMPYVPAISVIINTTDRAEPLRAVLNALEHQTYAHFEIIVVVGPTKDHTLQVLRPYETESRVRMLRCPVANLSQSRNIGLREARGEIVAFIDDDAIPCRTWLAQIARVFADPAVQATGGTAYLTGDDTTAKVQHRLGMTSAQAEQNFVRQSWLDQIVPNGQGPLWITRMIGTNMAFRRDALLAIGGFDEHFEWVFDEADVCMRLALAGQIVHPMCEAVVYHVRTSSRNRQNQTGHGRWWIPAKAAAYFAWKHGKHTGSSHKQIATRALHQLHGHQFWLSDMNRESNLSATQLAVLRVRGVVAQVQGIAQAIQGSWQNVPLQSSIVNITPITQFQNAQSALRHASLSDGTVMPEPPLRICLLSANYPPDQIDGVSRLTQLMAKGLGELGHAVHVIAAGERESVTYADSVWVHRVPTDRSRYAQFRHLPQLFQILNRSHTVHAQVQRLLLNEDIQVVDSPLWLSEGVVTAMSGIVPTVVRLVTAGKQIAEMNAQVNEDRRMVGEMERTLIERATHVLPNTAGTLVNARKAYGLPIAEGTFTTVPYGIVPVDEDATRPFDLSAKHATFTVLFVGRLEKRKGIVELFDAIPRVLERVSNARFVIAGADNSRNDEFFQRNGCTYPEFFARKNVRFADRVSFLGSVSDAKLNELYQACDVFVAPSLYESFGLIYLEAMNFAKPVVGCNTGGVPDVVTHGVDGVLVEPGQAQPLADAIVTLLNSPDKMREIGLAGRQSVLDKFSYLTMARNFASAYRVAIAKSQERKK